MEAHNLVILHLCALGFLKEFRPSEPFLSPFLNGPKNLTETQINNEIYPIGTYSNMSLLIVVFLLTDWLKYKPVILLQGLSGIFTWSLLLWTNGIPLMQVAQVSYGLFSACDVAYSSYLYAQLDKKHFQRATAQTKTALLVAKASSGLVAQVLVMGHVMDYVQLNLLTLASLSLATVWACFLPAVTRSVFFNRSPSEERELALEGLPLNYVASPETTLAPGTEPSLLGSSSPPAPDPVMAGLLPPPCPGNAPDSGKGGLLPSPTIGAANDAPYNLTGILTLWRDAMRHPHTLKWSLWSSFSLCGYLQVSYYIQLLWQALINAGDGEEKLYHGFSNSFNSLAGALCTYSVGYLRLDWGRLGEPVLAVAAMLQGALLLCASYLRAGLLPHYVIYALFKVLYQASSTIVAAEIASSLASESYGLVFGVNQFLALVLQSALTALVTHCFHLHIQTQFFLYGAYFILLGLGFAVAGLLALGRARRKQEQRHPES